MKKNKQLQNKTKIYTFFLFKKKYNFTIAFKLVIPAHMHVPVRTQKISNNKIRKKKST